MTEHRTGTREEWQGLEKINACKRRMGWRFPWVSFARQARVVWAERTWASA
jgi:Bacterial protein of unknown function (DUF899)